jgi:dipeptidase D
LNLDSEEDDILCIGCAGGCDVSLAFDCELEEPDDGTVACRVAVSGLRGGHSGDDIHKHRGNANRLLARTLLRADSENVRLVSIRGGRLRNVIPREAEAVVSGSPALLDTLRTAALAVTREAAGEITEEGLVISVEPVSGADGSAALSANHTRRILTTIAALPNGVMGMDQAITGLVETSNNIATLEGSPVDGRHAMRIEIGTLARSSSAACKKAAVDQIAAVGELAGAAIEIGNDYAGWQPNMESPTLATCSRVYKKLFGEEPNVTAIHAGLECGVIGDRVRGMDMVSFGPRIVGAHSPDERVYVASVQKSWRYLLAVLADLARSE